jgi:hypothetical protein
MLRSRRIAVAGPGFIEPCLPSLAKALPSGRDWLHEIKQLRRWREITTINDGLHRDGK